MNHKHLIRTVVACAFFIAAAITLRLGLVPTAFATAQPAANQPVAAQERAVPAAEQALAVLQSSRPGNIVADVSRETGAYTFVRADGGGVLAADNPLASPEERARVFLATNGAVIGMNDADRTMVADASRAADAATPASTLQTTRVFTDEIGATHVRFNQMYRGLKVFAAELIVHMIDRGITAVNGNFIPDISIDATPSLSEVTATEKGLAAVAKAKGISPAQLFVTDTELAVFRTGLFEGYQGKNVLAYGLKTADGDGPVEQVWISATTGTELMRIPLKQEHHKPLHRTVYSPRYDSSNPNLHIVRDEDDPIPSPIPFVEGLFQFSGQTYNMFMSAFGRSSFNGMNAQMRTVYLVNSICPNAYWDGATTNYCPEVDGDDVVAHEWGHAYTQFTHNLVYSFQSGALNESYSDIWGETVDIHNNMDGEGGSNNAQPAPNGQRWLIGEDVAGLGPLRDMWDPPSHANPDKVSSSVYHCAPSDGGGVHTNSGVPNHAYAMLVDGKTFNGQTVTGIGFTKAMHIYFRAMSVYQHQSTNFPHHAQSLLTACNDLAVAGTNLNGFSLTSAASTPSGQVITTGDCDQVRKAIAAVEMQRPPVQCNFGPLLDPDTPPDCDGDNTLFAEDWETGEDGWTKASMGAFAGWPDYNFVLDKMLPANRPGSAMYAFGAGGGVCGDPNGDWSGTFSITTPTLTARPNDTDLQLSFEHFVATEFLVDGGNVLISVNGGGFQLIPQTAYTFNAPPSQLRAAPPVDQNTNPKAGQPAWSGADPEVPAFGTTKVDLSSLVKPGDTFRLRWEFGLDGCGGNQGWYVDNIRVFNCPVLPGPTLSIGAGYENPDTNGSYQLTWTRPAGALASDTLQESTTSCAPLVFDDAENGMTKWNVTTEGTYAPLTWSNAPAEEKPQHTSQTFRTRSVDGNLNAASIMTYKDPIAMPPAGVTKLRFQDWYVGEGDDGALVQVSENGTTWTTVYSSFRSEAAPAAGEFFGEEPLFNREVDLSSYNGKTIRLRFRQFVGPDNRATSSPFGWYVDNISLTNENWTDVVTNTASTSVLLSGKPAGSYCYRVRTAYDIAGEQVPSMFSAPVNVVVAAGPAPVGVVSRKTHNGTPFDVALPLTGSVGVEPRRSARQGEHQLIFTFPSPVVVGGAHVSSGTGTASNFSANGALVTVNLTGVTNAQRIEVTLTSVSNGSTTGSVTVPMGVLLGDSNADGSVNSGDATQARSRSGQALSQTIFRSDVNSDGSINSGDASIVRAHSGTTIGNP